MSFSGTFEVNKQRYHERREPLGVVTWVQMLTIWVKNRYFHTYYYLSVVGKNYQR